MDAVEVFRRARPRAGVASDADARASASARTMATIEARERTGADAASTSGSTASGRARAIDFCVFVDNAHGEAFERSGFAERLRSDPALDSMARHRQVKKEISEAYGALAQCRRAMRERGIDVHGSGRGVTFVELCSGRGFVSLVLVDAFPESKVRMIDNDTKMNVSHVERFCDPDQMSFHVMDVRSEECEKFVVDACESEGAECVVLVGVHLCGDLSHRAIEIYERVPGVAALVLSPCCLPRRRRHDAFGFHCKDIARSMSMSPYQCWTTQLYLRIPQDGSKRDMIVDDDVLSQQNAFLIARRPLNEPSLETLSLSSKLGCRVVAGRSRAKWRVVRDA